MGSTVDLSWHKEQTLNLKTGQKRLCCLKNKEGRKRRKRGSKNVKQQKRTNTCAMGVSEVGGEIAEKNI